MTSGRCWSATACPSASARPDANDGVENRVRLWLLTQHHRYGTRTELFDGFPDDVCWQWMAITPAELAQVRYIDYDYGSSCRAAPAWRPTPPGASAPVWPCSGVPSDWVALWHGAGGRRRGPVPAADPGPNRARGRPGGAGGPRPAHRFHALETLTPAERAVFVLREVFDVACDQIAEAVGKSPAAVRQIAHRARAHVAARRPRGPVSPAQTRDALEAFQRAAETGDLQLLLHILAPDRVFPGASGGIVQAALAHVVGAGQDRRRGLAATGTSQRLPGADPPPQQRDQHRHRGTRRRRPHRAWTAGRLPGLHRADPFRRLWMGGIRLHAGQRTDASGVPSAPRQMSG